LSNFQPWVIVTIVPGNSSSEALRPHQKGSVTKMLKRLDLPGEIRSYQQARVAQLIPDESLPLRMVIRFDDMARIGATVREQLQRFAPLSDGYKPVRGCCAQSG
jgi:hypothetical protein